MDPLARYREIVLLDTEFYAAPSEHPVPVCVCARLLRSGREIMAWHDELGPAPPYPIGDDVLVVCFAAAAELEVHLALGWELPANVLDLRVEHIHQTGVSEKDEGQFARNRPEPCSTCCGPTASKTATPRLRTRCAG